MFLEHDDLYRGGGHQHILLGPKVVEPPPTVRTNLFVIEELAKRLGVADCPGFRLTERQHIDRLLANYGIGYDEMKKRKWLDCQPAFDEAHFLNGFGHPDGRFRFKADWTGTPAPNRPPKAMGAQGPHGQLPEFPDHVDLIEVADERHPFRLATSPARSFLNSTFAETPSSIQKEGRPEVMIHAEDAAELGIAEGDVVRLGNGRVKSACTRRSEGAPVAARHRRRALAQWGPPGRGGDQRFDRCRCRGTLWRSRIPRQPRLDAPGLTAPALELTMILGRVDLKPS